MKKILMTTILLLTIGLLAACGDDNTDAQNNGEEAAGFPEDNITIVVPYAAGGAGDVTIRMIADVASEHLDGQEIVVQNMEGGGGVIGQSYVAEADPDGYTLLEYSSSAASNSLIKETSFTAESFEPIATYSFEPELLVVSAESDIDDLHEFIEYTKENVISMNTSGFGTSHHIAPLVLMQDYDLNFDFIHTSGGGEQVQQLLGNHVESGFMGYGEAQDLIESGDIKPIGVMAEERMEQLPDVSTFKEEGIDLVYGPFRSIAAPAGTPQEVVDSLAEAFEEIINDEAFIQQMNDAGYEVTYGGPEELQAQSDTQVEFVEKVLDVIKDGAEE
ncbi:tripartite tricarboxylate transporter substrate binding protein [Gracilibacillus sp. S3-1-1]|uniref:Tripartite tricarboxylate transporter substrate binding protein n=1 Tax=Gracilibacillus pellucidus TaxID=3095368 RepID=A0ACC6M8E7_9BACI|nr:tripartite tricarboxylate transporter substrate binding protein [Gracilibacillus sp. S3-1-1]MDX8047263.1 tripartite tricarboxylate transporter substrate binding protein [Gracilibacillus sp. S3-1-1]